MNERISNILKNPWTIPVGVGIASFGAGVGIGYILGKRKIVKEFEEGELQLELDFDTEGLARARSIIEEEEYIHAVDPGRVDSVLAPETDAEVQNDSVIVRPASYVDEEEEETVVEVNVFKNDDDDWDWEAEVEGRDTEKPYILHRDEFYRNEFDFTQTTLTYYQGDDIMVDEDNTPVYNHLAVTGPLRFGHGSGDPNVFLVRNEERRAEYEILLHEGMFSQEVLGLQIEENERVKDLKHSRVGKFRMD